MRKLDYNEFKICQILGRIFEKSIELSALSSPMFIRRFMNYGGNKCFFDKSYLLISSNLEDIIYELNDLYSKSLVKIVYTKEEMYWIGYIYGALVFLYDLSPKKVYKLFPAKEIVKYYKIYHTFDIEEAAMRMMENINYEVEDLTKRGVAIYKELIYIDKLKSLIGTKVEVSINGVLTSSGTYKVSWGHLKDVTDLNRKNQKVIFISQKDKAQEAYGVVYNVLKKEDEIVLVVLGGNLSLTKKELVKTLSLEENTRKYKIIN